MTGNSVGMTIDEWVSVFNAETDCEFRFTIGKDSSGGIIGFLQCVHGGVRLAEGVDSVPRRWRLAKRNGRVSTQEPTRAEMKRLHERALAIWDTKKSVEMVKYPRPNRAVPYLV